MAILPTFLVALLVAADGSGPARDAAPDSPRAAMVRFLEQANAGDLTAAARGLDLPAPDAPEGPELARKLKAVLDRHLWIDPDELSGDPAGNTQDGLPLDRELVGRIPVPGGPSEPVTLVLRGTGTDGRWLVSRSTLRRVPAWYSHLENRWALEHLPPALLRPGPMGIPWWHWLGMPLALLVGWVLGTLLARLTIALALRITRSTPASWDEAIVRNTRKPVAMAWTLVALRIPLALMGLTPPVEAVVDRTFHAGLLLALLWALLRAVDVAMETAEGSGWAASRPAMRSLLPIAGRMAKIAIGLLAAVGGLAEFGYPVASLLAGLGIGGLALALAAQKTMENLFGAVAIGLDQPIRQGDFVKVDDFVGTVEKIGLRSTSIRTLDRTLVSLPNGRLADMRLESFSARDRIRLACEIGLEYRTTERQMREVLSGLEAVLRAHPRIWPDAVVVRFKQFGASSLDIEIMAWFQTADWSEFQLIRQEVLLQFMRVVEGAGSAFAYPTRTVHLARPDPG